MLGDPVHRVGEVREDEHLALVALVLSPDSLLLGFSGNDRQLLDEGAKLRVFLGSDGCGCLGEGDE